MSLATVEALKSVIKPEASRLLTRISRILAEKGIRSYLVGGFVRDTLLGRATADIDIAVGADALEIASGLADKLGGRYVPLDKENGVGRVILTDDESHWEIDLTTLVGDIHDDLARRDFTIDAMAIELNDKMIANATIDDIIDPFRGRQDLERGILRVVSDGAFRDDAARLVRGVRLAAELGFTIDKPTHELICRDSSLLTGVAGERVREELLRLLALPSSADQLEYLDGTGLLTALIPELAPARGVSQPRIHVWDVFRHSIETVRAVEFILGEGEADYAGEDVRRAVPMSAEIDSHFNAAVGHGSTRRSLLKLAALLHDIAKPQTKTLDETGRARFLGHPQQGADTATAILERLRFSSREIKRVALMVKYHLRPTQMSQEGQPTARAIYRYFRDTGDAGIDILFLCLADHLATRGHELDITGWREHGRMAAYVMEKHAETDRHPSPKLIDGHDIMQTFALEPGPIIGLLLEAVNEARAAGEVTSRQEALEYVRQKLNEAGERHE